MSLLKDVYDSEVDYIRKKCCLETVETLTKEISRAARMIMMVETLNCIDGSRDYSDDVS
jgi:hypothetical protein